MLSTLVELISVLVNVFWILLKTIFGFLLPNKRKSVYGKTILITGSAQGIGKEMATRFHKMGANLALVDINEKLNSELVTELNQRNAGKVQGYRCDLTNEQDIANVGQKILDDFGHVDILINNAGIVKCAPLLKLTSQDIRRTFDVNVFAHFWMIKQFLPSMVKRKSGHIVAISSIAGLTGTANLVDYCSSKFATTGMMEALDYELRELGHQFINLTTICPLAISTGMFKKPKSRFNSLFPILTPEFTAEKIVDAVLQNKNLVTIPENAYYLLYLTGKMLPYEAINLIRNFCVYGVDEH